jgi:hypothetical protein
MGEELGRCRLYGVEVVTLCRLEVTQRNKLIDAPWPELNGHASCSATAPLAVFACPHRRRRGSGCFHHTFKGYAMGVKIDLGDLRGEMADAIKEVARFLERETVRGEDRSLDAGG